MGGFAWVTLATNDSYSLGALVLAHSLRRVGTKHDLAVLVTPGVTGAMRDKLSSVFSLVQEVNVLDSKDEANLALLARPELGITFTKLHCWRLTQYEKCVFVDADTLVVKNCDELFEREELSAAPDVGWPDCFNSGVFVFKPSQQTFASLTSFAAAKGSFDGGDQGLLNQYFSDWAHKDISKHLPFIYNMCSTATYSYLPAYKQFGEDVRIIHFIGITKPWLQYFDTVTSQVHAAPGSHHLLPLLQLWWNIFCDNVHPQLSPVMASSILAQHWHETKFPSAQSHDPKEGSPHYETNETRGEELVNAPTDFSEFHDPWENFKSVDETAAKLENDNNSIDIKNEQENLSNDPQSLVPAQSTVDILPNLTGRVSESNSFPENPQNLAVLGNLENRAVQENVACHNSENHSFLPCHVNHEFCAEKSRMSHEEYCRERDAEENGKTDYFRGPEIESEAGENSDGIEFHENYEISHRNETPYNLYSPLYCRNKPASISDQISNFFDDQSSGNKQDEITLQDRHANNRKTRHKDTISELSSPSLPLPCTKSDNVTTQSETNYSSQLESNDAGIAGALAKITLGEARSQEQVAFEEHMRKQGWEQGQIDYMGRDSFDNIWKKISETLSVQPESQPPPPKAVPQLPKVETEKKAALLLGEEEPAAPKPEAAVLAELERTDEQDELLGEVAHELKELLSPLTELTRGGTSESTILTGASLSEAAERTVAPLTTASPLLPETFSTPEAVGSIGATFCDVKIAAVTDSPLDDANILDRVKSSPSGDLETPEKFDEDKEKTATMEIIPESQVPIQVAESVLEADVKESVSEDLKPVTEEAFSSISLTAQESVPAVLETAIEAVDSIAPRSNGTASPVGNGIDALCCPANRLASATVAVVERASDLIVEPPQLQGPADPVVLSAAPSDPEENVPAESAQPTPPTAALRSTEILEKPEDASLGSAQPAKVIENVLVKSAELSVEPPTGSQESTVTSVEPKVASSTVQTGSVLLEKSHESPAESVASAVSRTEAANVTEKQETLDSTPPDVSAEPAKPQEPEAPKCTKVDEPKLPAPSPTAAHPMVCPAKPSKKLQESSETGEKSKCSSTVTESLAESATEQVPKAGVDKNGEKLKKSMIHDPKEPASPKDSKASTTEEPSEKSPTKKDTKDRSSKKVPKPLTEKGPLKVSISKEMPKLSAEEQGLCETMEKSEVNKSIEASTEESSPVRPARTKELQIPDTPTIIEATPPTSPPIGGAESLEEQQQTTKVTKKTVKKVVKKTSEAKLADGNEAEGECKKVTKKIVKKVVKKKDEDGNPVAEATSATEKPKKIIKVVKKTTKTSSQTLDAEAAVPETPPPGPPEVPVAPKRKIKTTTKTTTLKSDSEQ